jgi:hypothetical protein
MFAEGSEFFPVFANAYRFCIDRIWQNFVCGLPLCVDKKRTGKPQNR